MRRKSPKSSRKVRGGHLGPAGKGDGGLQLSTPRSEVAILAELEGWIRGGRLEPGHRLPSIKAIQKILKVGQRGVEMALDSLSRRGLIETRNRSGNYLMANAREILAAETNRALSSSWVLEHYLPRSTRRTLTVYTIDCMGRMKEAWNQVIRKHQKENDLQIRLLTPDDGHLMEILKSQEVDVVHSTLELFQAIGLDKFHKIERDKDEYGEFFDDLLPHVRASMTDNLNRSVMPLAIMVTYLFLNRSMAAKFNLPTEIPSNPLMFLRMVRETQAVLSPVGFESFLLPVFSDFLLMTGGVGRSPEGRLIYNPVQTEKCLAELAGSRLSSPKANIPDLFADGIALSMRHCSFTCAELLGQARFDWVALPVPIAVGSKDVGCLTLVGVPRASQMSDEAFRFIGCLLSRESQSVFAAVGGNLPVRRSALSTVAEADFNHVLPETIHRALAQSEFEWPHHELTKFSSLPVYAALRDLLAGRTGPEVLLDITGSIAKSISEKA